MVHSETEAAVPTRIGIALVEFEDRFVVGTRPDGVPLAGYAEFPGGKCNPGESPSVCAERECFEETGLRVESVAELACVTHRYAHGVVELHFCRCRLVPAPAPGERPALQGNFGWWPREQLMTARFPEANAAIVEQLLRAPRLTLDH